MYQFHYGYIKNKYGNKSNLLFTDTDITYEIKTEDVPGDFGSDKEMFDFSNFSTKWKYDDDSSKLVIWKMKDETGGVAIEEFVWLKPKIYSFLVNNNEHEKAKVVNKNVVATVGHNEYKDVLLNQKYIRHSANRVEGKDNRIGTYEISKISLSFFDEKIYIQINRYDRLALGYNICLNNYLKSFFVKHIVLIFGLIRTAFLSRILNLKNPKNFKKV